MWSLCHGELLCTEHCLLLQTLHIVQGITLFTEQCFAPAPLPRNFTIFIQWVQRVCCSNYIYASEQEKYDQLNGKNIEGNNLTWAAIITMHRHEYLTQSGKCAQHPKLSSKCLGMVWLRWPDGPSLSTRPNTSPSQLYDNRNISSNTDSLSQDPDAKWKRAVQLL